MLNKVSLSCPSPPTDLLSVSGRKYEGDIQSGVLEIKETVFTNPWGFYILSSVYGWSKNLNFGLFLSKN